MNTESVEIAGFPVEVVRKPISNLHVGVYPPDGHVRVAAPISLSDDAVRMAVLIRIAWIKRQKRKFDAQAREAPRHYVSGETHYIFGSPYRLVIQKAAGSRHKIELTADKRMKLDVPEGSSVQTRAIWMREWYRSALREKALPRVAKWSDSLNIGLPRCGFKIMKTKWGSCNPGKGLIWLNVDLAKKPSGCLDYVILHEMAHFISPKHDEAFVAVLDRFMPRWRQVRSDLNAFPLSSFEA